MINISHLHPALVHFPIGIICLACLFQLVLNKLFPDVITSQVIKICLVVGIISAIPVFVTGALHAYQSEFTLIEIRMHMVFAVLSLLLSILILFFYNSSSAKKIYLINISFVLLFLGIGITGHLGGTLTHGPAYITTFPSEQENTINQAAIKVKPSTHVVEIKQMKFVPDLITVNRGDTVLFINKDFVPHNVVEVTSGAWASPKLKFNESWKLKVDKDADYYCSLHVVMKGAIKVADNSN